METLTTVLTIAIVAAVAAVLVMGLWNMAKGGSPSRSQSLMRMRVLLQFIAVIVAVTALYFAQR